VSATTPSDLPHGNASEAVAVAAERRWAIVVGVIIALLVIMMIVTGLQWASMPPSRVETVDVRTLHIDGEFVESNLGTVLGADGKVTVRLVAQQYSFVPACILVPVDVPVTFRGTSSDAVHGFIVGTTNANTMLIPGFVATFTTTFRKTGEQLMPCHEYCGIGHEAMWARVRVVPAAEFFEKARNETRISCVPR
jgi:cytochrome c oxidase subunit II